MQSPQNKNQNSPENNSQIFKYIRSITIYIIVPILFLAGAMFILDTVFSDTATVFIHTAKETLPEVGGILLGTSVAVGLVTVVGAPLSVAVGVGVVIWLILRTMLGQN